MVKGEVRTQFIGFVATIEKEGRDGNVQVLTQVQDMELTDKELARLKRLQEETAEKVEAALDEG